MTGTMTWAAMDVHARSTYAASLDVMSGELTRRRFDTGAVEPVVAWLAGLPGPVRACYEAGPTGFGLYRAAGAAGIDCQVIAPSKTPRASGDHNKSDRRDTDLLLRQLMAGALTPIAVPSPTFEAARDLARAREQVRADLMRCRHRVSKLLLRHGRVYDRKAWTQAHARWLAAQSFEQPNTELAFIDNLAAADGLVARKQALDERLLLKALPAGRLARQARGRPRASSQPRSQRRHVHPPPSETLPPARPVSIDRATRRATRRIRPPGGDRLRCQARPATQADRGPHLRR